MMKSTLNGLFNGHRFPLEAEGPKTARCPKDRQPIDHGFALSIRMIQEESAL